MKVFRSHLLVCGGTGCHASGSIAMKKALVDELNKRSLAEEIKVVETGCNGFCAQGPIMVVYPEGIIYMNIRAGGRPRARRGALHQGPPPREALLQGAGQGGADPLHAGNPLLRPAGPPGAAQPRPHRPGEHRGVHRPGRLRRHGQGAHRDDARADRPGSPQVRPARPRRRRLPHGPQVAVRRSARPGRRSTCSATPTRATPGPSWTAASSRRTRTRCSKAW